jgi:hypothetical protein
MTNTEKEYHRKYYVANKDKITEYRRNWRVNNPEKSRGYTKKYRDNNVEKVKECGRVYRRKYREINPELSRERSRNSRWQVVLIPTRPRPDLCEICGLPEQGRNRVLSLDHCHKTNKFRGWICNRCNRTLGHVNDSPVLLRKLAEYLEARM